MCGVYDYSSIFSPPFPPAMPPKTTDDADDTAGHRSFVSATMQTGFCDWSARYFAQPVMKVACASTPGAKWASHLCPHADAGVSQSPALGCLLALLPSPRTPASGLSGLGPLPRANG